MLEPRHSQLHLITITATTLPRAVHHPPLEPRVRLGLEAVTAPRPPAAIAPDTRTTAARLSRRGSSSLLLSSLVFSCSAFSNRGSGSAG